MCQKRLDQKQLSKMKQCEKIQRAETSYADCASLCYFHAVLCCCSDDYMTKSVLFHKHNDQDTGVGLKQEPIHSEERGKNGTEDGWLVNLRQT